MRTWLFASVLLSALPGCSLAAALAGADGDTVRALGELDRIAVPAVAGAIAETVMAATADGYAAPPEGAHLCWLNESGGDEIVAASAAEARAICQKVHGARADSHHCRCELLARR